MCKAGVGVSPALLAETQELVDAIDEVLLEAFGHAVRLYPVPIATKVSHYTAALATAHSNHVSSSIE
jgi:hypothetical protein